MPGSFITQAKSKIVFIISAAALSLNVVSLYAVIVSGEPISVAIFPYLSTILAIILSPIVALSEKILSGKNTKRQEMNRIKTQLDGARDQNRRLQTTRDDLQDTVDALNASQEKIDGIVRSGGDTQANFIQLIIKNHKLIKKMRESFKKSVLEDLKQIVLKKDKDGDFILDVAELKSLHNALRTFRVETGPFKVFQATVTKNGNDLSHVLKIVGNYLDEKEEELDRRTSNFSGRFDDLLHQYEAFKRTKNI